MRYVKWTLIALAALSVFAFLHYTLPQRDIVRITDTYERRIDPGENALFWASPDSGNNPNVSNRDVFFIQAVRPNGRVIVYRNEDTGLGWPPYFKFDTSNLQTEAADLRSTRDDPIWVAVRHYGWRFELQSIFPNAVGVREVDSPDVTLIPWLNIVILSILAGLVFWAWRIWVRFRTRTIDPIVDDATETWERVDDRLDDTRGRLKRWWDGVRGRPKK